MAPFDVTLASDTVLEPDLKLPRFERAGCASFWIVDPLRPSLTAWELRDGRYVEVAHVSGEQSWAAILPFAVTITPALLI